MDDRPLSIGAVKADRTEVPRYGRVQLTVDLRGRYANPFDPDEIALDGLVTTPSGRRIVVPGFYTQSYARRLEGDQEQLSAKGGAKWCLRIGATETGIYEVVATARNRAGRRVTARPVWFTALPSSRPGFVRRSAKSTRYFAFDDGVAYVPIGANVCWGNGPGTFSYDRWFPRYGAAHCNYARLWLGPTWTTFGMDRQGLGKIDLANAWRLDYVLNLAQQHGLYLMLCLDSYNELRFASDGASPFWEQTPHNAMNGGPLKTPGEFWTNPQMDRLYRNRLRYLVARYSASPHVLAWEFWNEVDIVSRAAWNEEEARTWHQRMGRYLRGLDPYRHLITTSFSGSAGNSAIDRLPELDYVQTHTYGAHDPVAAMLVRQEQKGAYGKPHYVGECGIGENDAADKQGLYLHDALWGGLFAGGAGTGMLWWWDSHIDPNNLYPQFAAISGFMRDVDPVRLALAPSTKARLSYAVALSSPRISDLELPVGERSWEKCPANQATRVWVSDSGEVRVDAALSGLLHGLKNHPDLHNPVTFNLNLTRSTHLLVQVSGVSGYGGGHLVARRNGEVVLDKEMRDPNGGEKTDTMHDFDGTYTIAVPTGQQSIVVENQGIDWMYVGYMLKDGRASTEPPLRVLSLAGPEAVMAWVQNPQLDRFGVQTGKEALQPVSPSLLELSGLRDGPYRVTLWDTHHGLSLRSLQLAAQGGALSVPLPEVTQDLAVKAIRE